MLETLQDTTQRIEREDIHEKLKELPENHSLFKCHICKYIFDIFSEAQGVAILVALIDKSNIRCPRCNTENVELICKVDAYSVYLKLKGLVNCRQGIIISGTDICPVCKRAICPECFNHSCVSLSRVTGYVQDVSGWNAAKKQELIERKRYIIDR